jgi:hypothetical protein
MPSAPPRWLYRRFLKGVHMPLTINNTQPGLTPNDWLNVIWVTTRVMGIIGLPPLLIHAEEGTPGILWVDPENETVLVVLNYESTPSRIPAEAQESKMNMHISEQLSEGVTMALVGLCTMRNVLWDIITGDPDDDDDTETEQESEPKDTKPGS